MVFSPDDQDLFMEGDVPLTYSADPNDDGMGMIGGVSPLRMSQDDADELDVLLGQMGLSLDDGGEGSDDKEQ
jgi:hypothetical protein